jgi:hypothetical protein
MARMGLFQGIFGADSCAMIRRGAAGEDGVGAPWRAVARGIGGGRRGLRRQGGWGDALLLWRLCAGHPAL